MQSTALWAWHSRAWPLNICLRMTSEGTRLMYSLKVVSGVRSVLGNLEPYSAVERLLSSLMLARALADWRVEVVAKF